MRQELFRLIKYPMPHNSVSMPTFVTIHGRVYAVEVNPSCNCDHWHYMFVKGSRKPKKFHHAHPHKAHKSRYAFHKHSAAQKASLKLV